VKEADLESIPVSAIVGPGLSFRQAPTLIRVAPLCPFENRGACQRADIAPKATGD
jgi:hypothetical protein